MDSHNYLQVSPLCEESRWFQSSTKGGRGGWGGGWVVSTSLSRNEKSPNGLFRPVISHYGRQKKICSKVNTIQQRPTHRKTLWKFTWAGWEKQRRVFRRSASTKSHRCVKRRVPSSVHAQTDPVPRTSAPTLPTACAISPGVTQLRDPSLSLSLTRNFFFFLSFLQWEHWGGGGRLNRLVRQRKKERDGSNWIHRFLRN